MLEKRENLHIHSFIYHKHINPCLTGRGEGTLSLNDLPETLTRLHIQAVHLLETD